MYISANGKRLNNGVKFRCNLMPGDNSIIAQTFRNWVGVSTSPLQARQAIYHQVVNIPFALVGLKGSRNEPCAATILEKMPLRASCLYKTELLAVMFKLMGYKTFYHVTSIAWADALRDIPDFANLSQKAEKDGVVTIHAFFGFEAAGKRQISLDASWDPKLVQYGFRDNLVWDGRSSLSVAIPLTRPVDTFETRASFLSAIHRRVRKDRNAIDAISFNIAFNKKLDELRARK